ncbi:MAG: hypothetical protein J2P48_11415 [Alphaproteobacteria bacterium]|nr:hypothetical protein [Alphaproteobacteria bacterium]
MQKRWEATDVLMVSGCPGRSTVAALLAQKRRRIAVIEKACFPQFHFGKSRLSLNLPLSERLSVGAEVERIGVDKLGAAVLSDDPPRAATFGVDAYLSVGFSLVIV